MGHFRVGLQRTRYPPHVPVLELRRPRTRFEAGLGKDTVVAPYATALAAMYDAKSAVLNFEHLTEAGGLGRYGFYEALDFTASRLPKAKDVAIVRAYMAHHQGMTLVALANATLEGEIRNRFHRIPMVQATELLLQETRNVMSRLCRPRSDRATPAIASSTAGRSIAASILRMPCHHRHSCFQTAATA